MVNIWILPLAILGIAVSSYMWYKRAKKQPLACLMGEDCNKVVRSKYSRMFGVPNAMLGVGYYGLLIIFSLLTLFDISEIGNLPFSYIIILLSGIGLVFYTALIYIQFYKINEWCGYCLSTAILTLTIFVIEAREVFY